MEDKADKALKETDVKEKVYATFRTYDRYGRLSLKDVDITDLVREQVGDDLSKTTDMFAGLKYTGEVSDSVAAYHIGAGQELKGLVSDMTAMSVVNAKQLEAIKRHTDRLFAKFDESLFGRLWA